MFRNFLRTVFVCCIVFMASGCTDPQGATKTLQAQGYTNIVITGYRFGQAGEEEAYATGFKATSPSGIHVTGTVTSGFQRGYTVRLD